MPFDCRYRARFGPEVCLTECPTATPLSTFHQARVERAADLPPADPRLIDVAVLDMHHGWPNLGHDAIVHAVQNAVCDITHDLGAVDLGFRVTSYDVRHFHAIPEPPGARHLLYVGTGGPGHLDPERNDGVSEGSQGITEDPAWERPLFALFDRIRETPDASLLAVCHTFGVMCRWLGIADPRLRGAEKGGKSTGIVENILTEEGVGHPWFSRFARALPDGRRLRVLDNRLYDLVPRGPLPEGITAIGYETLGLGGPPGDALTMVEVARDRDGVMPRIFGVNHHPEIVNRPRQIHILRKKLERGDVTEAWYEERMRTLTQPISDDWGDRLLHLSASYTFMAPLRFQLYRLARERAQALGLSMHLDERRMPLTYDVASDSLPVTQRGQ